MFDVLGDFDVFKRAQVCCCRHYAAIPCDISCCEVAGVAG